MRARLTASFVVLSVVLLVGGIWVHEYTQRSDLRMHESQTIRAETSTLALVVEQRQALGRPVDRAFLAGVVDSTDRLSYDSGSGDPVVVEGDQFTDDHPDDAVSATADAGPGSVSLTQAGSVLHDLSHHDPTSLGFLLLLVALVAALAGYLMAYFLTAPFRQLAGAAAQLGRGRFDLGLPRSRIPEVRALNQAMLTSAGQLQERLASEQAFAEHASHVLRTPLTGLRLELEVLLQRHDLPADVRLAVTRSLGRIDAMDEVAGDLVSLARRGALVAGAEIPLRDLATQAAQAWADALAAQDRPFTAAVEGSIDTTYTPGPVEHVLDLLLADVLKRGDGAVRLVLEADREGHLSIDVSCAGARGMPGPSADIAITQARAVVTALGGRVTGDDADRVSVLLPRR